MMIMNRLLLFLTAAPAFSMRRSAYPSLFTQLRAQRTLLELLGKIEILPAALVQDKDFLFDNLLVSFKLVHIQTVIV